MEKIRLWFIEGCDNILLKTKDFYLLKVFDFRGKYLGIIDDIYIDFHNGKIKGFLLSNYLLFSKRNFIKVEDIIYIEDVMIIKALNRKEGISFRSIKDMDVKDKNNIIKGQIISTPNSLITTNNIKTRIYLYKEDEGNNTTILKDLNSSINISLWNTPITGKITNIDNIIRSGEYTNADILLDKDITIDIGYSFKIIEDNTTVGVGVITEVNN